MGACYVVFKGNDTDIEMVERLIAQINAVSMREAALREYLDDTSGKNELLKTFISHVNDAFGGGGDMSYAIDVAASNSFIFDRSEKTLTIDGVYTDEWAAVLSRTFPALSFFITGDLFNDIVCGMEWKIYNKGTCVNSEYNVYNIEEFSDDQLQLIDKLTDCVEKLAHAKLSAWKLSDGGGQLLKKAEKAAQTARRELDVVLIRLGL